MLNQMPTDERMTNENGISNIEKLTISDFLNGQEFPYLSSVCLPRLTFVAAASIVWQQK